MQVVCPICGNENNAFALIVNDPCNRVDVPILELYVQHGTVEVFFGCQFIGFLYAPCRSYDFCSECGQEIGNIKGLHRLIFGYKNANTM